MSRVVRAGAFLEDGPVPPKDSIAAGDEDALLDALYRSESPKLVRILLRRTSSHDDAHDLVQDVFFRFARLRRAWLSSPDRPQAYFRRIATNLLKDRSKADFRHLVALHVVADEESLPGLDQQRLLESRDMVRRL